MQGDLFLKDNILLRSVRASLHEVGGPQAGEVTCLGGVTTSGTPPQPGSNVLTWVTRLAGDGFLFTLNSTNSNYKKSYS